MQSIKRRQFIKKASLAGSAALLAGCASPEQASGPAIRSNKKYEWKMVTTWPRDFPGLGTGAQRLADNITAMSQGRLEVKVYAAGELVGGIFYFNYPGGSGLTAGSTFGKLAGTSAGQAVTA